MKRYLGMIGAVVFVTYFVAYADGQDWTRFRGPGGTGIADDSVPVKWSPTTNVKWKAELPGAGVSSPIVVGDKVFVTCYSGYGLDRSEPGEVEQLKRHVVCIGRDDGKLIWDKTVEAFLPEDAFSGMGVPVHGYASHTPVSDGENVYAFLGKSGVVAFDLEGNQLWQTSVGTESDDRRWGSASSPILYKDLVIVPAVCESMSIVALNKKTGEEVWKEEAETLRGCWGTPAMVKVDDDRSDLVFGVPGEIWGMNPETGKLRWMSEGIAGGSFYTSVTSHDGIVYASAGGRRGGGSLAVKVGGKGDVSESHVLWTGTDQAGYASPIISNNVMFLISRGVVTTLDTETGEQIDKLRLQADSSSEPENAGGRRGGRGGADYSSPVIADGKLYYVKANGETYVYSADQKFEQLAVNSLSEEEGETFNGSPAISGGQLFLRSNKFLYCIEGNE